VVAAGEIPAILGRLAALQAALAARLISIPPTASAGAIGDALIDAPAMAALLGCPESWVRTAARQGRIPFIAVGRYIRFRAADVQAALAARESKP